MLSNAEIADGVIERIARKAGYTLPLTPTMSLTDSPLSLSETKVRRLANNLRKFMKDARADATLKKQEVIDAKNVRGVVQLLVKKILDETIDDEEADSLIDEVQAEVVA